MKLKVYKRTDKDYQDIFEKEKEVKEIKLTVKNTILIIAEHQLGLPLDESQITIITDNGTHSMNFDNFIKNVTR